VGEGGREKWGWEWGVKEEVGLAEEVSNPISGTSVPVSQCPVFQWPSGPPPSDEGPLCPS
jgi:hypothetical protein